MSNEGSSASDSPTAGIGFLPRIGLFAGPILALTIFFSLDAFAQNLSQPACATAAVAVLMAVWWMSEAIPLEATSLLPLVLLPLTGGAKSFQAAAVPYADKNIFLYLGGFMLALAVERWGLHRRVALLTLLAAGTRPAMLVGGFMLATAGISLWISNTATAVMMLPIGLAVVQLVHQRLSATQDAGELTRNLVGSADATHFSAALLLGIAYAASLGGMGTLIGTPPNVFFRGFLEEKGISIGFGQWMLFALPVVIVFLLIAWLLLTKLLFPVRLAEIPGGRELVRNELAKLGQVSRGEWTVLAVFVLAAMGWVFRDGLADWKWFAIQFPLIKVVDDSVIAMSAAVALFLLPINFGKGVFALDWQTANRLPWGVLLLFGGGLSLSKAIEETKLADWIGTQVLGLNYLPTPLLIILVVAGVVFFSEMASNLATATALLPILYQIAIGLKLDPLLLCVPAILAASCGFMLPVATPPNAIVFGTGRLTIRQMVRAGIILDLVGIVLITAATYLLGWILGIRF